MKLVSGGRLSFSTSIACSSHATCAGTMRSTISDGVKSSPGVARSAPRSNRSFWMRCRSRAVASGAATAARPMALFASSTSPIAIMRGSCLARRDPSTSPVVPSSPVRV
jgi:hypothetical protein